MGQDIKQDQFDPEDYERFRQRLNNNLAVFRELLLQPGFGEGPPSFGAELELYIIDNHGAAKPINTVIHQQMNDEQLTLELNRFNLEYNFAPVKQGPSPFTNLHKQMDKALVYLSEIAASNHARILPIGILPTLQASDLGLGAITDLRRYHVLAKALRDKRGSDFHIKIDGQEPLDIDWEDVSPEGANTSFQFHYRVELNNFADAYNASQLAAPLALALSANSPFFLGRRLWQETRIALFKQSIDYRIDDTLNRHLPARVLFGLGWVRTGIYEIFSEGVYLFDPILPICSDTDPLHELHSGQAPSLPELRLHQGSIWNWNRPIYDPADGGHLRIELRALPAGPTPCNMLASAALMSGLIRGLQDDLAIILPGLPFRYAEQNFYRAAKHGLQANLFWPNLQSGSIEERPVIDILKELLPLAEEGLSLLGVCDAEIITQMDTIRGGLETRINGAQWQTNVFEKLIKTENRETALTQLVELYYKHYKSGKPVHEWSQNI